MAAVQRRRSTRQRSCTPSDAGDISIDIGSKTHQALPRPSRGSFTEAEYQEALQQWYGKWLDRTVEQIKYEADKGIAGSRYFCLHWWNVLPASSSSDHDQVKIVWPAATEKHKRYTVAKLAMLREAKSKRGGLQWDVTSLPRNLFDVEVDENESPSYDAQGKAIPSIWHKMTMDRFKTHNKANPSSPIILLPHLSRAEWPIPASKTIIRLADTMSPALKCCWSDILAEHGLGIKPTEPYIAPEPVLFTPSKYCQMKKPRTLKLLSRTQPIFAKKPDKLHSISELKQEDGENARPAKKVVVKEEVSDEVF